MPMIRVGSWLMAFALVGCKPGMQGPPAFPPPAVVVAVPLQQKLLDYRLYSGRLDAVQKVEIRARVRGYLDKVHFREGAEVAKGTLLYEINKRTFKADLAKAEAEANRADAMLRLASSEADRLARLRGTGASNEEEYLQKIATRETAKAAVAQAKAAIESATIELEFASITAPIAGRLSRTLITEGNLVGYNEPTLLTTIVSIDPVYVYFETPEHDFLEEEVLRRAHLAPNPEEKKLPIRVGLENEEGFPHAGVVDFRDNQIDGSTGTILIRGVLANPLRDLSPGLFARVQVPFGQPQPRLLVPEEALGTDQSGRYVLIVDGDNKVESRTVKTGTTRTGLTVILKGLNPTDRVIIKGQVKARPGGVVMPEDGKIDAPSMP